MMRHKCALCGTIQECNFLFSRNDAVWAFELFLCHHCGIKISNCIHKGGTVQPDVKGEQ